MGDRANVAIQYAPDGQRIYFYTHWNGTELPETVRQALLRKERWEDDSYLARIIFNQMTKGNEDSPTGFGIAPWPCDTTPVIVVDTISQTVRYETTDTLGESDPAGMHIGVPFAKFIERVASWNSLRSDCKQAA